MNQYLEKLKVWWNGLSESSRKLLIGVPILAALLYFVVFRGISNEVGYATLFKNIELEKASVAAGYLDEQGIDYKLQDGGRTILVPRKHDVNRLKLNLAEQDILISEELPGNMILLQGGGIGGEEQNRIRRKIGLESNLARIIKSYRQVEDAKVLIAEGKESAFVERSEPAKASVTLTLKGDGLEPQQVKGISRFVANAVRGLDAKDVVITNQSGDLLSQESGGSLGLANQQLEYKKGIEHQLEDKAQRTLNKVLGPNQAEVTVNADINYEESVTRTTSVDPEQRIKTSENVIEISDQRKPPFGGIPGTDSQLSERLPLLRNALSAENRTETRKNTEYQSTKSTQIEKTLPGEIERLTIALAISSVQPFFAPEDGHQYKEKVYNKGELVEWVTREQTEIEGIGNLVKDAVGFDAARGDTFTIEKLPFYNNRYLPSVAVTSLWQKLTQPNVLLPSMLFLALCAAVAHYLARRKTEIRYREELRLAEAPSVEVSRAIQELATQIVHSPEVVAQTLQDMIQESEEEVETTPVPVPVEEPPIPERQTVQQGAPRQPVQSRTAPPQQAPQQPQRPQRQPQRQPQQPQQPQQPPQQQQQQQVQEPVRAQ